MKRIAIDFDNLADYEYESGGAGFIGSVELFSSFQGRVDELLWLNGTSRWVDDFEVPTSPHNGNSDHLEIPIENDKFDLTANFCFSCFASIRTPFGSYDTRTLLSLESSNGNQLKFAIGVIGDLLGIRLAFEYTSDGSKRTIVSDPIDLSIGPWYHFAYSRKNDTLNLFFNGKKVGSGIFGNRFVGVIKLRLGASKDSNELVDFFQGQLDEILFDNLNYRWDDDFLIPVEPFSLSYSFSHNNTKLVLDGSSQIESDLVKGSLEKIKDLSEVDSTNRTLSINLIKTNLSDPYRELILADSPNHYFPFDDLTGVASDIAGGLTMETFGNVHPRRKSSVNSSSFLFEKGGYGRVSNWQWRPTEGWSIEMWYCFQNHNNKTKTPTHRIDFSPTIDPIDGNHLYINSNSNGTVFAFSKSSTVSAGLNLWDGNWHYQCCTLDPISNILYFQIDNVQTSVAVTSAYRLPTAYSLGYMFFNVNGTSYFKYNHLSFYNNFLTLEQRLLRYSIGLSRESQNLWLLSPNGQVLEEYTGDSIIYDPPEILRDLSDKSVLSVSSEGKAWNKINNNSVDLYERSAIEPVILENQILLDYTKDDYTLDQSLSVKITPINKLQIDVQELLQEGNEIRLDAQIINDNADVVATLLLDHQPSLSKILLPYYSDLDSTDNLGLLIFNKLWGNVYSPSLSKTEPNHIHLEQTNLLSPIKESNWLIRKTTKISNFSGNLSVVSTDDPSFWRITGLGENVDIAEFDVLNNTFEVTFEFVVYNASTNFTLSILNKEGVHPYIHFRLAQPSTSIYLAASNTSGTLTTQTLSAITWPNRMRNRLSYKSGILLLESFLTENPTVIRSTTISSVLNIKKLKFTLTSANAASDFVLSDLVISNLPKSLVVEDSSAFHPSTKLLELDYHTPFDWNDGGMTYGIEKLKKHSIRLQRNGVDVSDNSLIHVQLFNQPDYVRGFCGVVNGYASYIADFIETEDTKILSFMNFDNGHFFQNSVSPDEIITKEVYPSMQSTVLNNLFYIDYNTQTQITNYEEIPLVLNDQIYLKATIDGSPITSTEPFECIYTINTLFNDESYDSSTAQATSSESEFLPFRRPENKELIGLVPAPLLKDPKAPSLYFPFKNKNLLNLSPRHEYKYREAISDNNEMSSVPDVNNEPESATRISHSNLLIPVSKLSDTVVNFTICFWMRDHVSLTNTNYRYPLTITNGAYPLIFKFKPGGIWSVEYRRLNSYTTIIDYNKNTSFEFCDQWSHVAIVHNSLNIDVYKNGVLCTATYSAYSPDIPLIKDLIILGDKNGAANDFTFHDFFLFDRILTTEEIMFVRDNPDYYHLKNEATPYSGAKFFHSTEDNIEIQMDPAVILNKEPLKPKSLIKLDYSEGTLSDVNRVADNKGCVFKALGTFETSRNSICIPGERTNTDRQIQLYYDYLGITNKTPKLTPMKLT